MQCFIIVSIQAFVSHNKNISVTNRLAQVIMLLTSPWKRMSSLIQDTNEPGEFFAVFSVPPGRTRIVLKLDNDNILLHFAVHWVMQ
jgi:hypothetical protein